MNKIRAFFEQIICKSPFNDYQIEPAKHLAENRSVILRMPTGSGKSESILCAYLWALTQNEDFPHQMLYGLPMRNLVNSLASRFTKYQTNFKGLSIGVQHGERKETPKLYSDIVVGTIDQLISAYACTPLGHPIRGGNIPAGAVASAFLVFDEVHTFDPERALQSTLFIVEHSYHLGLPFAFLSATMPDSFIKVLEERFNAKIIDVDEKDIPIRAKRQVRFINCLDTFLTPVAIKQAWLELQEGSLLVVCNTIQQAQDLWEEIGKLLPGIERLLLHSAFTATDRKKKEKEKEEEGEEDGILHQLLGKNSSKRGIVITTQVVEVGLDVSTSLLLTELAPVDALIQRAGRVARWGGQGEVRVYNVEKSAPYSPSLVETTYQTLPKDETILDWKCEQTWVNQVLGPAFTEYLTAEKRGKALYWLGEGAFSGKRSAVAKAIRDNQSCTIAIHEDPNLLGKDVWRLPQIRFNVWKLYSYAREASAWGIWRVVTDETAHNAIDQQSSVGAIRVSTYEALSPGQYYVLSPEIACYEADGRGFVLGEPGESMPLLPPKEKEKPKYAPGERESWQQHCINVLDEAFYKVYLPRYETVLARLAAMWKVSPDEFINRIALCAALHDLGKLNAEWQQRIGRQPHEVPIGHSGDYNKRRNLPPHATISAYLAQDLFRKWGRMSPPLLCAIAHHHSVRAKQVPVFQLIPEWVEEVTTLLTPYPELLALWDTGPIKPLARQTEPTELPWSLPDITAGDGGRVWRTYTVVSRLIRLSDQMATGGSEDAILRDENWFTDV